MMSSAIIKEEAYKLIRELPENATWEDLMHKIYVRESIERGLADSQAGRIQAVSDVRQKYGLSE
jgi:hypothetical protein